MKIKILFDLNENIQGKALHFSKGEIADIPDDDAWRMINALEAEPEEYEPPKKKRGKKEAEWPDEQ